MYIAYMYKDFSEKQLKKDVKGNKELMAQVV